MATPDYINLTLLVITSIGVIAAFRQILISNKQKRADLIVGLCNNFNNDRDIQDIYYKIEYSVFIYYGEVFHGSPEERQLDKLLYLFSNICQLYEMNMIKEIDLEFIKYELIVVYKDNSVQQYLDFLDADFKERQIEHIKFRPFRHVAEKLMKNYR